MSLKILITIGCALTLVFGAVNGFSERYSPLFLAPVALAMFMLFLRRKQSESSPRTKWFVLGASLLIFLLWFILTNDPQLAVFHAALVLVLSSALFFSPRPVSIASGTATPGPLAAVGAANSELPPDTLILEQNVKLTHGEPQLQAVKSLDPKLSDFALLQRVASLAKHSEHSLAQSILAAAKAKKFELLEVENFKTLADFGFSGLVSGRKIVVGSAVVLRQEGINPGPLEALATGLIREGLMVALIGGEGRAIGMISIQEPIDPQVESRLVDLKNRGIKLIWLTSAAKASALSLAQKLKIDEVHAELGSEQNAQILSRLRGEGRRFVQLPDGDLSLIPTDLVAATAPVSVPAPPDSTQEVSSAPAAPNPKSLEIIRLYSYANFSGAVAVLTPWLSFDQTPMALLIFCLPDVLVAAINTKRYH